MTEIGGPSGTRTLDRRVKRALLASIISMDYASFYVTVTWLSATPH